MDHSFLNYKQKAEQFGYRVEKISLKVNWAVLSTSKKSLQWFFSDLEPNIFCGKNIDKKYYPNVPNVSAFPNLFPAIYTMFGKKDVTNTKLNKVFR